MVKPKDKHHELRQYLLEQGIEEAQHCTPEELELLEMMLSEMTEDGNSSTFERLVEEDYSRPPPDIQEFVESSQYLGEACRGTDESPGLFPKWREVLYELFDSDSNKKQLILAGGIGLGKSEVAGTPIPVDGKGTVPIEKVQVGDMVRGLSGLRKVTATYDEGELETLRIKTKLNHQIECGYERHRLLVMDCAALTEKWQFVNSFAGGEVVLLYPGNTFGPNELPDEEAFLLGLQVAEGVRQKRVRKCFYLSVHRDEANFLTGVFPFMHKVPSYVRPNSNTLRVDRYSDLHREVSHQLCIDKVVPEFIKGATRRTICQFLRGCFSGDGTAFAQSIGYSTASRQLAVDVQELLLRLGMLTRFEERDSYNATNGKQGAGSNQLWLHGEVSKTKFVAEIGFFYPDKQAAAILALNDDSRHNEHKYGFKVPRATVDALIMQQPHGTVGKKHPGYEKSPRRLLKRLRTQKCTTRLLREVLAVGGVLPKLLQQVATGEVFFDQVESVERNRAHCYDLSVETVEDPSFISAGFMSHNSFIGSIVVLYKLCCALCLRNPLSYYGMSKVTSINFSYFSITQAQVKGGTFADTINMMTESPFFTENIRNPSSSKKYSSRCISFAKNLRLDAGSRIHEALGRNTLVALIDEINFRLEKDASLAAADLFNAIEKRYKSRFRHTKDGMLVLISSAKAENDFLSAHIRRSRHDPTVKICEFPWWEVVGPVRMKYSGKTFQVDIGDNITPASILQPGQEKNLSASRVITVPEEHREDFEGAGGLDRAIRDVAGVATGRVAKLFPNMMPLINCIRDGITNPFKADVLPLSLASLHQLSDCLLEGGHGGQAGEQLVQFRHGRLQPLRHATMPRFLHIDISSGAQDNCGVAMVHPFATAKVERTSLHNQMREMLTQPLIEIDFAIGLKRETPSDPLDFGKIRAFILWLRACGFDIRRITCDLRAMSQEMRNILTKMGFRAEYLSCDKTKAPYESFRIGVLEGRIHMGDQPCLLMELANLEDTEDKVDHPANFTVEWKSAAKFGMTLGGPASKDIADAVAGACYNCVTDIDGMTDVRLPDSQTEYMEELMAAFPNPLKETFELPRPSDIQVFE